MKFKFLCLKYNNILNPPSNCLNCWLDKSALGLTDERAPGKCVAQPSPMRNAHFGSNLCEVLVGHRCQIEGISGQFLMSVYTEISAKRISCCC